MRINGKVWHSGDFWLVEAPMLDLATQAQTKNEIPAMMKDVIETLINDPDFIVDVTLENDAVLIEPNDDKKLIALILKRQRSKRHLTLEQVAKAYGATTTDYAQYEHGKHMPSFEKLDQILEAINPEIKVYVSC